MGLYLLYEMIVKLLHLRQYKTCQIADMKSGDLIDLPGQLDQGANIPSPLTQTPCLPWRILVTEDQGSKRKRAVVILDLRSINPFPVTNKNLNHSIKVLPIASSDQNTFTVSLGNVRLSDILDRGKPHYQVHQHLFKKITDQRVIELLNQHNINLKGVLGTPRHLKIEEYIWQTWDPIYIFGKVSYEMGDEKVIVPQLISRSSRKFVVLNIIGFAGIFGILLILISFLFLSPK